MYKIIDGKAIAQSIREELAEKITEFKKNAARDIGLAVILVGENPASQIYVHNKIKACEEVGIKSFAYYLTEQATQKELEDLILSLANDDKINGILVQLPLPAYLSDKALKLIPDSKDVDGFSANNIGKLCLNTQSTVACTPYGVMKMLEYENIEIKGKNAVVVGRSNIVGKPMAMLLLNADATVTVCHSKTKNLKEQCQKADILVSAIGKPKFITADMVKDGAIVIDVGMNRDENGKLCGDVDFANVKDKCSYITPVPGGVGPMTITMLMYNTYLSAVRSLN
ncbi:MAG: bifunctional methylenetetrahydrofolate dehydrogenase/methenyltetrahydrofolate cyclohydrolase FolD [Clostridia bacterium]|nr:bifunctional methylenetetrahydrofolate dehydrogenase/methenyltetrahydrofolate cyclohydrolase FolD [Clostridia bacterium]